MTRIASTVEILFDGEDITRHVMPVTARFEGLMSGMPGQCEFTVKDKARTLSFVTGKEILLKIDGTEMWGGYCTSATRKFAFPAVRTDNPANVTQRLWVIRGVDFNVLFDRRVLRNPLDYLHHLPNFTGDKHDGELLREALTDSKYFDVPAGFDVTTEVDDVVCPFDPEITGTNDGCDPARIGAWPQQGSTLRQLVEDFVQFSGAVYYFGPDKKLHHHALEDVHARWGFSDAPNHAPIDATPGYQDATIGPRGIDATEDGTVIVNDALIWGGSEWAGEGSTVFARRENAASQTAHQRWQTGEVHFGEEGYKLQQGVDARAEVIVNGAPGAVGGDANRGLRFPQWDISLTWFAHDVPRVAAVREHLKAGDLVHIELHTFGDGVTPLEQVLPLRSVSITFPATKPPPGATYVPEEDEIAYVEMAGTFSLQLSDPYTLWRHLMKTSPRGSTTRAIATVDGSNPAPYGALFTGEPTPAPDGAETVFDLPDGRAYIGGTTEVYMDGDLLRRGIDYTESAPTEGEITLTTAPAGTSWLWVVCRTS